MKTHQFLQYVDMRQQAEEQASDNSNQVGDTLIINGYCLALTEQPKFDFSDDEHLKDLEKGLNDSLNAAIGHANDYISNVQNNCLVNLNNIINAFSEQDSTIDLYKQKVIERDDVIDSFSHLEKKTITYQSDAENYKKQCDDFRVNITNSSSDFTGYDNKVQTAVDGDGGEITDLKNQVAAVDKKIKELTATSVLSAIGILGGACLICIGAATDVFTGGAATAAIVVGVGVVGTSAAGEIGSTVSLIDCYKTKNKLLAEIHSLQKEVSLSSAVQSHLSILVEHSKSAADSLVNISKQWGDLQSNLNILNNNLKDADDDDSFVEHLTAFQAANKPVQDAANLLKTQYMAVQPTTDKTKSVADQMEQQTKAFAA